MVSAGERRRMIERDNREAVTHRGVLDDQPGPVPLPDQHRGLLFVMHVYADGTVDVFDRDGHPRPDVDLPGILQHMAENVRPEPAQ